MAIFICWPAFINRLTSGISRERADVDKATPNIMILHAVLLHLKYQGISYDTKGGRLSSKYPWQKKLPRMKLQEKQASLPCLCWTSENK